MKTRPSICLLISSIVLLFATAAVASDKTREQAYAEQIIDFLVVGEPVWLAGDDGRFLGLYTEADDPVGAAVLLHGRGVHPNWADVVFPLRDGLPGAGWTTLAIQMPIAARGAGFGDYLALFPEVPTRIDAALAFLHERGYRRIVLIGHSLGAMMGANYLAQAPDAGIAGFVVIGLSATEALPVSVPDDLARIEVPVLDLYGGEDLPDVRSTAWIRAAATASVDYRQIEVPGADHFFSHHADALLDTVQRWLDKLVEAS